jgi:signal transduction histidine kinase
VIGPNGEVLSSNAALPPTGALPFTVSNPRDDPGVAAMPVTDDVYFVSQQVPAVGGNFTVAVASPFDGVRESVDTLARTLWFLTPMLALGVGLLAWVIAGRALRPVEAIRAEVLEISHTTMHRRVPVPDGRDEVQRLAETMNGMLDRLEDASARQREFVSDASHELRSPVAAMRTDLEVALRDRDADWPALGERVLAENERLGSLIDDLLALARIDEHDGALPDTVVDLDEIALTDATRRENGIAVDTQGVSGGRVRGNARQLAQVVHNLVDNARRHATTKVVVSVVQDHDTVVLAVDDDGPGIPAADRGRVFERFTRLDEARARDGGGSGLGLAVVARIVAAHGGTVRATEGNLGGACFEVRFPAA